MSAQEPPTANLPGNPSVPTPKAQAAAPAKASDLQFRLAGGYGFGVGDHDGSFRVLSGTLKLQSAVGSSGDIASGQVWVDNWLIDNWTIGLEYIAIRNAGKAQIALPKGLSILTDPVDASARVKLRADMGFLNAAYRQASGSVHALIGAGFGIGYGHASAGFDFYNAFLGGLGDVAESGSPIAGIQLFSGVDIDLGPHAYLSVMPRVIIVDAHPIGIDQRYMDFGVTGLLGLRF